MGPGSCRAGGKIRRYISPTLTADLLNEIYPVSSRKSKTNEVSSLKKARTITARFQKEIHIMPKSGVTWVEVSVKEIRKNFQRLDVSF